MGNRYTDTYVYAVRQEPFPQCVYWRAYAVLGNAYEVNVTILDKHFRILDLLGDSCETEGERLPEPGLDDWCTVFSQQPKSAPLEALTLADIAASDLTRIIWLRLDSVRAGVCDFEGYVISREGCSEISQQVFEACQNLHDPEDVADCIAERMCELL